MLPDTIKSVLEQTFSDWELIVVDDGSTDNTKEVVSAFTDARIQYIYQENAERSAARNNGIKHAKGQYICFLDSDDYYEANHLETLYRNIKNNNFPIALLFVHDFHYVNGEKIIPDVVTIKRSPLMYFFTQPVIPARVCIHNEILETVQFDEDIVIVEDMILWVRIASQYPVIEIQENTIRYNLHEDNSINIKNNSYYNRFLGLRVFFKRYPGIVKKIPCKIRTRVVSDTLFGVARHYNFVKDYWKMIKYLCLSIVYAPVHEQTKAKIHMMLFPGKHRSSIGK